jgi:hypothetical protein
MTFLARTNKNYGTRFKAKSWKEAKEICDKNMWHLDGEFKFEIPAIANSNVLPNLIISLMK